MQASTKADSKTIPDDGRRLGVLAELPRRRTLEVSQGDTDMPQMRVVSFRINHLRSLLRLYNWIQLLFYFSLTTLVSSLLGRDTPEKRAGRLRRAFEHRGGSFIKLGIHLSMRVDFLPWVYCRELSGMFDRMKPFPTSQAIATIERSTGKPLAATFERLDPDPILSTSVACTYQAFLRTGEKVIVKVRRPGIGEQFMSDIEAFDWLLIIAEVLTIFRPGFTQGMRAEFRNLLLEELDFLQEARKQDAFRRAAAQSRKSFFSTPRIYLELSGEDVVINDFASGMWLWELLSAVAQGNESVLAQARERNIDPRRVARRLLWVNSWSHEANLFFHADPNPDNIIVGQDSTLYFINFAATGTLNHTQRQAVRQNLYYASQRDAQGMARAVLTLMEPLPPVDILELTQELEAYNWDVLYALEAAPESVPWEERTSAIQWIGMIRLARKYGIVIDIQVLRLIRSTLLCESISARLHPSINYVDEYKKFLVYMAEQARRRVTDGILDRLDGKSNDQLIIRLDRMAKTAEGFFFRTMHLFSLPTFNFSSLMSKWSFAVYMLVRFAVQGLAVTLVPVLAIAAFQAGSLHATVDLYKILGAVTANRVYQLVILILIFINGRTVLFRMDDKEV